LIVASQSEGGIPWSVLVERLERSIEQAAKSGGSHDGEAWSTLERMTSHYAQYLRKWDRFASEADIEDLSQDLLAKLLVPGALAKLRELDNPAAYFVRAVRYYAIDQFRRRTRMGTSVDVADAERLGELLELSSDRLVIARETRQERVAALRRALATLSSEEVNLVWLRVVEERDLSEVAEMLGLSYSVAGTKCFRALRKLRKLLEGEFGTFLRDS
jgi:RNA polymerase sigma factor (sigma-70 family)